MNNQLYHSLVWGIIPLNAHEEIDEALDELGDLYNSPIADPFRCDFESYPILKYAYFYRYFTCISNAVRVCWLKLAKRCFTHYICRRFSDFLELGYNRPEINVCCIGGGSGSDLVGLCQFMDHYNIRTTKINAVILDYYDWSNETRNLLNNIPGCAEYGLHYFNYVQFDFYTSPITNEVILQIRNADLITIVKFLSAVGVDDSYNFIQLQVLLSHMKRNARVFFMDNSGGRFGEVMGNAAQSVGLELICEVERKRISVCECEYEEMGNNRFQTLPQKTTSVSASLWKRN